MNNNSVIEGRKATATSFVADLLRSQILEGVLSIGQQLNQDEIAKQMDTSRIPVREAFRQLESEGLITVVPYRGVSVSSLDLLELDEIFDLRIILEIDLLKKSVPVIGEAQLMVAQDCLLAYEKEILLGEKNKLYLLNWRFHKALYEASGAVYSLKLLEKLHNNLSRYIRLIPENDREDKEGRNHHTMILDAYRNADLGNAITALESHLRGTQTTLISFLDQGAGGHCQTKFLEV